MTQDSQVRALRIAFVAGAITDALALVPMLSPGLARILWGFDNQNAAYQLAMGYGASLMLGWTLLLIWAYQKPIERRFVALLTMLVIVGLALTQLLVVLGSNVTFTRMLPTWFLQTVLLTLFAYGYFYQSPRPDLRRQHWNLY